MNDRPTPDPRLPKAIESCRRGIDDPNDPALRWLERRLLTNPELERLYSRVQKIDRAVAGAFSDVPVPDGLADRILARLAQAAAEKVEDPIAEPARGAADLSAPLAAAQPSAPADEPTPVEVRPHPQRPVRRRWFVVGGVSAAVASAAAILAVTMLGGPSLPALTAASLRQSAAEQFEAEADVFLSGSPVRATAPPAGYDFSREVTRRADIRWRWTQLGGRQVVAYDLQLSTGQRGTLYVARAEVTGLPPRLPARPALPTSRCSTSAWQEGPLAYVLVVHGGRENYRRFLAPAGPIT